MSLRAWVLAALLALSAADAVAQAPVPRLVAAPGTAYFVAPSPGNADSVWFGWSWPEVDPLSAQLFEQGSQVRLTPLAGEAPGPRQTQAIGFPGVAVGPQGELWLLRGGDAEEWLTLLDAAEATLRRGGQQLPGTQLRGVNSLGRFGPCTIYSAPPLAPLGGDTGQVRLPTLRATAAAPPTTFPAEVTPGGEIAVPRYSRWLVADGRPCTPGPADTLRLFPSDSTQFFLTLTGVQLGAADPSNGPWPNWVPGVREGKTGPRPFTREIVLKAADLPQPGVEGTDLCAAEVFRDVCSWDRALRRGVYTVSDSMGNRAGPLVAAVRASCASLLAGAASCGSVGDRLWRTRTGITAAWGYGGVLVLSTLPRIESHAKGDSASWIIAATLADSLRTTRRLVLGSDSLTVLVSRTQPGRSMGEWILAALIVLVALLTAAYLHLRRPDVAGDLRSRLYRELKFQFVPSTALNLANRSHRHPLDVVAFGWALRDPEILDLERSAPVRWWWRTIGGRNAKLSPDTAVAKRFEQLLKSKEVPQRHRLDLWTAPLPFLVLGGRRLGGLRGSGQGKKQQYTDLRGELAGAAGTGAQRAGWYGWRIPEAGGAARWAAHLALGAELASLSPPDNHSLLPTVLASELVLPEEAEYLHRLNQLLGPRLRSSEAWMRVGRDLRGLFPGRSNHGNRGGGAADDWGVSDALGPVVEGEEPWLMVLLGFTGGGGDESVSEQSGDLHQLAPAPQPAGSGWHSFPPDSLADPGTALLLGWWLKVQPSQVRTDEISDRVKHEIGPEGPQLTTTVPESTQTGVGGWGEDLREAGGILTHSAAVDPAPDRISKLIASQLAEAERTGVLPDWVSALDRLLNRTAAAAVRHTAEQNLTVGRQDADNQRLQKRETSLAQAGATIVQAAADAQLMVEHLTGAVAKVLDELRGLPLRIHAAVGTEAEGAVDGWKKMILDAARNEAAERVRREWAPYQTRIEQILPDLVSPEAERSAHLLRELHGQPGLLRDLLSLRSRVTDHTWSLLVNPADAALAEDHRDAGADAVQSRVERVVKQIHSLPGDGRARVQEVLVNVDVLARWAEQLWRVLLVPAVNDTVTGLPDAARAEWDQSYRALLHFVVNHAGAYSRLLSAVRGDPDGRAERPRLVDAEVLRGLDGGDVDIAGRLRTQLVPPERLGELDRVVLAIQYLTEAFPLEQLERIQPGLGDSLFSALQDRLSRASFAFSFHDLVRGIAAPLGLEYRPVVYYQSSIDAQAFRFIDREVSRISLSQRLGYEAKPASETVVVRLERPFFFDAVHKHYYAGFAHVARP